MTLQNLDFGTSEANDGETLFAAFTKIEANFVDLYGSGGTITHVVTDVASAATCDIGAAATDRVRITGTTTITSLGTVASRLRFVHFSGALTLTHNATSLICIGAANIITVAGDTAILSSDADGNWRMLSFNRGATLSTGDFVGPGSSTDNAIVRFDGTGGKTGQNSGVTISDTNDITGYDATNDGNPEWRIGAADAEELHVQAVYDSGAQTLDYVLFTTDVASATADKGLYRFNVDGTAILDIDDGGINFAASKGISVAGTDILTDAAGTATLSNIDALDATTEATIEAAIDTLANLTSVQGQTVTLAGAFITSGANSLTLTTTGATNVTLPTTGTLGTLAGAETLSNKVLTLPQINDTSADHQYIFAVSELAADRTVTLPLLAGNDVFVFADFIQTLTNKTIALGSNTVSGTLAEFNTAVTDADFASLAGSETLTNKTLTTPDINGGTADSLTSLSVRSTGAAFDLLLASSEVLGANRTLSVVMGDAARTLTFSGNPTLSDWFDQSVKAAATPQFTGIEIGHASDTTLTRASAGVAAIEGSNILLASGLGSITQAYGATLASLEGLSLVSGDIIYATGADTLARLAKGTDGQFLRLDGGLPDWETVAGGGDLLSTNNLSDVANAATAFTNIKQAASTTATGVSEFATTAEYRVGTDTARSLVVDQVWAAGALVGLTDGANIAVDMSLGFNFSVTLAGNRTLDNPTNPKVGQTGAFVVTQDATGTRTLAYGTNYEFAGGTAFVLTTTANAKDVIFYWVQSATSIVMTGILKAVA